MRYSFTLLLLFLFYINFYGQIKFDHNLDLLNYQFFTVDYIQENGEIKKIANPYENDVSISTVFTGLKFSQKGIKLEGVVKNKGKVLVNDAKIVIVSNLEEFIVDSILTRTNEKGQFNVELINSESKNYFLGIVKEGYPIKLISLNFQLFPNDNLFLNIDTSYVALNVKDEVVSFLGFKNDSQIPKQLALAGQGIKVKNSHYKIVYFELQTNKKNNKSHSYKITSSMREAIRELKSNDKFIFTKIIVIDQFGKLSKLNKIVYSVK